MTFTRRAVVRWSLAGALAPLLAACAAAAPPTPAPPTEAPKAAAPAATPGTSVQPAAPAAGAKPGGSLAGTKLTILTGNSFVPAQDKLVDDMVAALAQRTGMDAKVERPGAQMAAKIAKIIESGAGGDIAIMADTDPFLYGDKLLDVTAVSNEIGAAWGGW